MEGSVGSGWKKMGGGEVGGAWSVERSSDLRCDSLGFGRVTKVSSKLRFVQV